MTGLVSTTDKRETRAQIISREPRGLPIERPSKAGALCAPTDRQEADEDHAGAWIAVGKIQKADREDAAAYQIGMFAVRRAARWEGVDECVGGLCAPPNPMDSGDGGFEFVEHRVDATKVLRGERLDR